MPGESAKITFSGTVPRGTSEPILQSRRREEYSPGSTPSAPGQPGLAWAIAARNPLGRAHPLSTRPAARLRWPSGIPSPSAQSVPARPGACLAGTGAPTAARHRPRGSPPADGPVPGGGRDVLPRAFSRRRRGTRLGEKTRLLLAAMSDDDEGGGVSPPERRRALVGSELQACFRKDTAGGARPQMRTPEGTPGGDAGGEEPLPLLFLPRCARPGVPRGEGGHSPGQRPRGSRWARRVAMCSRKRGCLRGSRRR